MRGRKSQPAHLKLLRGNPGKRAIPSGGVQPKAASTRTPAWLDPIGKRVWRLLAKELALAGLLTVFDKELLETYCATYARMRRFDEAIRQETDLKVRAGLARAARQEGALLKSLAAEMGLSQTTRGQTTPISAAGSAPSSKWDGLIDPFDEFLERNS
jgi:P27 family predicted phage terminase small subunit